MSKLLDFLDYGRAKRYWGHWKGVRTLLAYTTWFVRSRRHPAVLRSKSSHNAKDVH